MKKVLSLLLSLVMLASITAGIDFSAYADDVEYTTISTNGTWYQDYVTDSNNVDWYKFAIPSDGKITIKVMHYATMEGYMYNNDYSSCIWNGSYILNGGYNSEGLSGGSSNSPITSTITRVLSKGTYFISMNQYKSNSTKYKISIQFNSYNTNEIEPNNFESAMLLSQNREITGAFTYQDDLDWYKLYIPQRIEITIKIQHYMTMDWFLYNYDLSECIIDGSRTPYDSIYELENGDEDSPKTKLINITLSKGTYYIKVSKYKSNSGKYKLSWNMNVNVSKPNDFRVSSRNTTSLKLAWNKVSGVSGYQLQRKSGNSWKTVANTTATSCTVKSLKAGTAYTFRVRAYKTINGAKYYSGWRTLTTPTKPATVSFSSLKAGKKKFTAKWKKTACTGYQIQYSTSSKFKSAKTVTVGKNSTTSKTVSKLKAKKKYYVRVRAYKTVNGTKYYGAWSKTKTVKTK